MAIYVEGSMHIASHASLHLHHIITGLMVIAMVQMDGNNIKSTL